MLREKADQTVSLLKELDIDLWIIVDKESDILSDPVMDYIVKAGVTWLSFFLFFKGGEKIAIIGNLDLEKFRRMNYFDELFAYKESPKEALVGLLNRYLPKKIALNYSVNSPKADGLTFGKYLKIKELLEDTEFFSRIISGEQIVSKLIGRKSDEEVEKIREAVRITQEIYSGVSKQAKPGISEKKLAAWITEQREHRGLESAWDLEHCPSVFTGPQEIGAHSGPTEKKLERGHVMNIDFGVKVNGYCSDLQRTWYILKESESSAPEEVDRGFQTIVETIQLAFKALRPGVKGVDIDKLARDFIISRGFDPYPHALGHQVGRSAHDGGALLGPAWERYGDLPFLPLEANQVFTIEPRVTIEGYGVATVEEMVLITEEGAEYLSSPQQEILLID